MSKTFGICHNKKQNKIKTTRFWLQNSSYVLGIFCLQSVLFAFKFVMSKLWEFFFVSFDENYFVSSLYSLQPSPIINCHHLNVILPWCSWRHNNWCLEVSKKFSEYHFNFQFSCNWVYFVCEKCFFKECLFKVVKYLINYSETSTVDNNINISTTTSTSL